MTAARSRNGHATVDAIAIALDAIERNWNPVPVLIGEKSPKTKKWQKIHRTRETVDKYFSGDKWNVGVQMGPMSNGLADTDLDCAEAIALAPYFLAETGAIYGRPSKRQSHRLYVINDPEPRGYQQWHDEDHNVILELRIGGDGKGALSILPGSLHPSGEFYAWDSPGQPAKSDCATLKAGCIKVAVASLMVRHWPSKARHDAALRVGGFLARAGWDVDTIGDFIVAVQETAGVTDHAHVENGRTAAVDAANRHAQDGKGYGFPALVELFGDAVAKTIAKIIGYREVPGAASAEEDGRPVMQVGGGRLSDLADKAEKLLIEAGVPFYERSNKLARPIVKIVDTFHGRKTSVAQLARVEAVYARDMLCRIAVWVRFDMRSNAWVRTDPPPDVAPTMLARAGEWAFPTIAGIITTQTMRPDGTIFAQPGYDPATRLLLIDPPPMVPIPENPTRADAEAALALLTSLLTEFPLVDDVGRAVALSTFITPVVRGAFSVTPMHVVDAPVPGAGKSYLLDTAAVIATGQLMPVFPAGRTEEETEKRLGSALLASQSLITIDNVNGELSGDALCQIVERPRPQVRILGKSELVDVETRGTSLFANGNNIVIVGDLCRRVIRAQLDPKLEQPELRIFTGNPVETILADRGAYVAAALTICRAYVVAGRPNRAPRLASFEGWSDTVRSALMWLGQADPVTSMAMSRDDDPQRGALRAVHVAWAEVIGTGYKSRMTLKDVIALIAETKPGAGGPTLKWPELATAVHAVAGDHRHPSNAQQLGNWMRGNKQRVLGSFRFELKSDLKHGSKWWIALADGEADIIGKKDEM
jgi:Bifunctional DNA primase/polymerase, N-terminal